MRRLQQAHPGKVVEVWAQDEARLGLQPVMRRTWALRGQRPRAYARRRYAWLYVYGFVRPATGQNFCVLLPRVTTDWMAQALAAFARAVNPRRRKVLVLLVDNAGWHVARRLAVPANVVLHFLPPCTPELQPAEPLWPLLREVVANRGFATLGHLQRTLVRRCQALARQPALVRKAVGFHWAIRLERS